MSIEIRIPSLLRVHADNQAVIEVSGSTVKEAFEDVGRRYPALGSQILGNDGDMHKFMNVYLNDDDIRYLDKLSTAIKDGDSITILPAVAGGAD